ncbi:MAG: putative branched-chain amino acid transport system substrate-binding protein precursor, partial [Solirubrobacteraceae bacterium]|nr:putative branched-chain amino acid transport system substrate-binding protein precursor [Solirubrobacteraceae bacterium]
MQIRSRRVALLVAALAVAALLASCAGNDKKSSSSGSTATTAATLKGDPVVIGNIGSYSTSAVSAGGDTHVGEKAIKAWASWVNAHGGINGHPLKLVVEDDANDPVKSKAAIQKLVEVDKVIAIVDSNDSSFDATWAEYVTAKNIPVIGGLSYGLNWLKAPFFLLGADVITNVQNQAFAAKAIGAKKFSTVICNEAAVCAQAIPLYESAAKLAGIGYAPALSASSTAANYTAQCVQMKNAGVDAIAISGANPQRLKDDCARQGYTPAWVLPATAFTQSAGEIVKDAVATIQTFPWFYDGPEAKDYQAAMKQYANIADKDGSIVPPAAWISGLMFQRAVELSGAKGVPTTADLFKGLNSFKGETLGGLAVPL